MWQTVRDTRQTAPTRAQLSLRGHLSLHLPGLWLAGELSGQNELPLSGTQETECGRGEKSCEKGSQKTPKVEEERRNVS